MSWSGTVTCSYCYRQGHNKRKCPELSERIKNEYTGAMLMVKESEEKGNEHDAQWYAERAEHKRQEYIKRTKIDLATGEKVTNKAAKAARMKKSPVAIADADTRAGLPAVELIEVFIEETRRWYAALESAREVGMVVMLSIAEDADGQWRRDILITLRQVIDGYGNRRPLITPARRLSWDHPQHRWTSQVRSRNWYRQLDPCLPRCRDACTLAHDVDPPKAVAPKKAALAIKHTFPTRH